MEDQEDGRRANARAHAEPAGVRCRIPAGCRGPGARRRRPGPEGL